MKDSDLDQIKEVVSNYKTFEEFYNCYLTFLNVKNMNAIQDFYTYATTNEETWQTYKYFKSEETINLIEKEFVNINSIIDELNHYNLSAFKRAIVRLDNKTYKDIEKLKNLNLDFYFVVKGDKGLCSIDEFINMRSFFDFFKSEYSTYNLSELEKVTLCYDYVKFFLYNEEENDNKIESRSISKSLITGNIVCEGYSKIFCQLLNELGMESNLMYLSQKFNNNQKHVRPIVYINDLKYGINDYYLFDPTWDSYKTTYDSNYSTVKYDYFLININDYGLYFFDEEIDRIVDYKTNEKKEVKLGITYNNYINYKMLNDIFNSLIRKIKTIEGYSQEQIDEYLSDIKKLKYKTM